jgi:4-amino-4-deoxy-L-arabinose transferase-like glycosyltransferase
MLKEASVRIAPVEMPHWLWLALVICLAGHVLLSFALGLSVDEAHYALYATHPALSYFDHPPLVGWLQIPFAFLGAVLKPWDWLMRVVPLALWCITAWALWRFSIWALVLFLLSPIHHLLGLALIPDSLLLPLTLWVMVLTWKLSNDIACKPYWLWLGVALGLAGLSKYTGVFLALGVAITLFWTHGVAVLKARGLYLAAVIALVLILPVLIWNAQNDWASFTYQLKHAAGNQEWRFSNVLRFDVVQLLAYGTLPLLGVIVFLWKLQNQHRVLTRISLAFGLPLFVFAAYSAGRNAALPHWTTGAWLAFLPAAALGLQHLWISYKAGSKPLWIVACGLGALQAVSVLALAAMMLGGGFNKIANVGNPFADLHDWQGASKQATKLQANYKVEALAVSNWTLASRLAWYSRPSKVWALDGKNQQFEMWFGKLEYGQSYIWMDWSQMPMLRPVGCRALEGENSKYSGKYSQFDFYLCGRP